jgi:hypothetical protein
MAWLDEPRLFENSLSDPVPNASAVDGVQRISIRDDSEPEDLALSFFLERG